MKSKNLFLIVALFVLSAATASADSPHKRYVLTGGSPNDMTAAVESAGGQVVRRMRYFNGVVARLSDEDLAEVKLSLDPAVTIEEDKVMHDALLPEPAQRLSLQGKPVVSQPQSVPWGITSIQAPDAWLVTRGAGIVICVLDSGIDPTHPDLAANIVGGENFVGNSPNPAAWADDNGHGSHVAGSIAALDNAIGVVGVAPEAKLLAMKIADRRGSIATADFAEGIMACVERGAHLVNMSFRSYPSTLQQQAFALASERGIVLVAAAGNSPYFTFPAQDSRTIAAVASDEFGGIADWSADVQANSLNRAYAAPGVRIYSSYKSGGYTTLEGTSMSAGYLSGVVALKLASGSLGLVTEDLGLPFEKQGQGQVNAYLTVMNAEF